jgi:hypothetical protein
MEPTNIPPVRYERYSTQGQQQQQQLGGGGAPGGLQSHPISPPEGPEYHPYNSYPAGGYYDSQTANYTQPLWLQQQQQRQHAAATGADLSMGGLYGGIEPGREELAATDASRQPGMAELPGNPHGYEGYRYDTHAEPTEYRGMSETSALIATNIHQVIKTTTIHPPRISNVKPCPNHTEVLISTSRPFSDYLPCSSSSSSAWASSEQSNTQSQYFLTMLESISSIPLPNLHKLQRLWC